MRLLYLMLVIMMTALLPRPKPKRRLSDSGPPLLQSADGPLKGAGSDGRRPRPRDSANHTAGGPPLTLEDVQTSSTNRFGIRSMLDYILYTVL